MRFGSVCSGIEAASVAWEPLGWSAEWFAEVEPFPSAVLAHHWPDVPNVGDMLGLPGMIANDNLPAPDVLVGGTPCQAFSVAGRRGSLEDERGALSLAFVELANEIDRTRRAAGAGPAVVVWENVPGVLNTRDNAFGCLLAGLAGEDRPLEPAGPRWTNAGCVFGPARTVAWRILDAQYFGVAQRRRRVFVVASARNDFDPCEVLFERDGVRRDTPPRRETGQDAAADAGPGAAGAGCFWNGEQVRQTLDAVLHKGQTMPEKNRFPAVLQPTNDNAVAVTGAVTHALNTANNGKGSSEDGTGRGVPTVAFQTRGGNLDIGEISGTIGTNSDRASGSAPMIAQTVALRGRDGGGTAELGGDVSTALRASTGGGDKPHVLAFNARQDHDSWQDRTGPLDTHGGTQAVATSLVVRRLTPRECERLQGFPDDHTLIAWRKKPAEACPDGPRYKAIGNSMAVPVMRWIGERIAAQLQAANEP